MVKKHFILFFVAITCVSFVFAASTEISVKTLPNHDVYLSILNYADPSYTWQILKNASDAYGDVKFVYTSDEVAKFDLRVIVKSGEDRVHLEEFKKDYPAGTPISITAAPEGAELLSTPGATSNQTNLSLNNNSSTSNNSLTSNESSTEPLINQTAENDTGKNWVSSLGFSILDKGKAIFTGKIFYYILGIVVIAVFVVVIRRKKKSKRTSGYDDYDDEDEDEEEPKFKVKKLSELKAERQEERRKSEKLEVAERKLKEAQEEVSRLRNTDRIEELEEEIRRLKGG